MPFQDCPVRFHRMFRAPASHVSAHGFQKREHAFHGVREAATVSAGTLVDAAAIGFVFQRSVIRRIPRIDAGT